MRHPALTIRISILSLFMLSGLFLNPGGAISQDPIRIMPLGNSITYGNYHPETRPEGLITGYRQSLWLMLTEAGYDIDFVGTRSTGADAVPAFDPDNEGYPGWRDDQIEDNVFNWLWYNPADVVILHIGTNGLDPDPSDVEGILDEIDRYENNYGHHIKVILAKIINRSTYSQLTTQFNQNIEKMALDRVMNDGDDIVVIDMEFETDIDYRLNTSGGEMYDNLHPFVGGHEKMAMRWFKVLREVLPRPNQKPYITSMPNPYLSMGDTYGYQVISDGNPVPAFSLLEAPEGMVIDWTSGLLTWTPAIAGIYYATILAENSFGTDTQYLEINAKESDTRIKNGLVALYEFTEAEGNLIHDVSGVGHPLNLFINDEGNVTWDSEKGLEITHEVILVPSHMNMKVIDSCMVSNAITLEAWIRTGNIEQDGPAHIVCITDPLGTGITLSQGFEYTDTARYFFTRNLQTSTSIPDGSPALATNNKFSSIALQHLVYTRGTDGVETFYMDGEEAGTGIRTGDFSSWNENTFKLSLCNSLEFENAWTGKLFLTAIYNTALSAEQVEQNYNAGFVGQPIPELPEQPSNLGSTALSAVAARLTWDDISTEETSFVVERKVDGGSFRYVASVTSNASEYINAGLSANTSYQYRIKALNDFGESAYSNETTVKTFSDDFLSNVSRYKTASQSSTVYGGEARLAIDGDTNGAFSNGSVTHTAYELNAWWEVDLEEVFNINYIEVWNRTDLCCKDRMARFNVFISEEPFESYDFQSTINQPGVWAVYEDRYPEPMVMFNVTRKGRYIRLQLSDSQEICLAELVAMGSNHLDPPIFITTPLTEGVQDQEYTYIFDASDPDADSLVFTIIQKPSWLIYDPATGSLSGIPLNADTGNHQVTINAYDGLYNVEQSYTLHVQNVNDPPVIVSIPLTEINQDEVYSYVVEVNDPDNDPITFEMIQNPSWLELVDSTGTIMGIPANEEVGTHDVTIRISDGIESAQQSFIVTVLNVNDPPLFTSEPVTEVLQGELYIYAMAGSDPDEDTLVFEVLQIPEWLSCDSATNTISGIPGNEHVGTVNVTVSVSDGTVKVNQEFQISVINVNDPPVFVSDPIIAVEQDVIYSYALQAYDPDGDTLTYLGVNIPIWLVFDSDIALLTGIPSNENVGIFDLKIRVSDGMEETDQDFQLTVYNVPDPPVITSTPEVTEIRPGDEFRYQITAIDVDIGDVLSFTAPVLPEWLELTPDINTALLSGTPALKDTGTHAITIKVSDGTDEVNQEFNIEVLDPTSIHTTGNLVEKVYPIPADEMVYFEFSLKGDVVLKLYDITGTVLKIVRRKNSETLKLDISDLPSNLYFYMVSINGKSYVGKLIKN